MPRGCPARGTSWGCPEECLYVCKYVCMFTCMYVIFWLIFAGSFPGIPRSYFVYIAVPRLYFIYIAEPSAVSRRTPSQRAHSEMALGLLGSCNASLGNPYVTDGGPGGVLRSVLGVSWGCLGVPAQGHPQGTPKVSSGCPGVILGCLAPGHLPGHFGWNLKGGSWGCGWNSNGIPVNFVESPWKWDGNLGNLGHLPGHLGGI